MSLLKLTTLSTVFFTLIWVTCHVTRNAHVAALLSKVKRQRRRSVRRLIMKHISKALRMARVRRDHTVLPAIHTFIHEWNESSCLYSQPQSIAALWPVPAILISRPTESRRLGEYLGSKLVGPVSVDLMKLSDAEIPLTLVRPFCSGWSDSRHRWRSELDLLIYPQRFGMQPLRIKWHKQRLSMSGSDQANAVLTAAQKMSRM